MSTRVAAMVLTGVFVAAGVEAGRWALDENTDPTSTGARAALGGDDPTHLNNFAWIILTDPKTTPEQAQLALKMSRKAMRSQDELAFIDTYATALYRTGDLDGAMTEGSRAMLQSSRPFFASQLARFAKAKLSKDGPFPGVELTLRDQTLAVRAPASEAGWIVLALTADLQHILRVDVPTLTDTATVSLEPEVIEGVRDGLFVVTATRGSVRPGVILGGYDAEAWALP